MKGRKREGRRGGEERNRCFEEGRTGEAATNTLRPSLKALGEREEMMERRVEDTGDTGECWSGFWPLKLCVTSNRCFMCRGFYFEIVL